MDHISPSKSDVFTVLDAQLNGRDYLAANRFTFVDALLLATLNPALRRPEDAEISAHAPSVRGYFELHSQRPTFVDTAPGA